VVLLSTNNLLEAIKKNMDELGDNGMIQFYFLMPLERYTVVIHCEMFSIYCII
jgi:hypothetical protein